MSSIIEGYTYDIFISYRQKDNRYDGWVTEFVEKLKKELEATFKEEISLYFDTDPHDGLLETHDVDATLRDKLKCLIFIPVISRTYCDPASFAWKNEFMAFIEQAGGDAFGLKIILKNGNVTSRVLPVRIHDLEEEDLKLCESVLCGILRPVDFIYKSPGVNRPLRSGEDHPQDNLNRTYYRDQINKVANAAEEIISSLKRESRKHGEDWSLHDTMAAPDTGSHPVVKVEVPDLREQYKEKMKPFPVRRTVTPLSKLFRRYYKYIIPIAFLILLIVADLAWKGKIIFNGAGNAKRETARLHVQNAVGYMDQGFYAPAKDELEKALAADPGNSAAWSTMAAVNVRLGNLDDAILETIEALKHDPSNNKAAYNLAYALDDNRNYQQALTWYKRAIAIDSSMVPAYSALGNLYNRLDQPVDAILILDLAVRKFPSSEYMYLLCKNMGNSHLILNQYSEAVKWLQRSLDNGPGDAETDLYMAKALEGSGNIPGSIEYWQKYIGSETDSAKVAEAKQHLRDVTVKQLQEIIK
jgi:tetratricopeptide (TPR) repeat protein